MRQTSFGTTQAAVSDKTGSCNLEAVLLVGEDAETIRRLEQLVRRFVDEDLDIRRSAPERALDAALRARLSLIISDDTHGGGDAIRLTGDIRRLTANGTTPAIVVTEGAGSPRQARAVRYDRSYTLPCNAPDREWQRVLRALLDSPCESGGLPEPAKHLAHGRQATARRAAGALREDTPETFALTA